MHSTAQHSTAQHSTSDFSSVNLLGTGEFDDIDRLLVIAIQSTQPLTTRSGKKSQYELAKKILKDEDADAAIFAFYDADGNFRFSFIQANYIGTKRDFTDFRRYTYFVDKNQTNQTNRTFKERIGNSNKWQSLDDIREAFSVEPLNKAFYKEIQTHFDNLKSDKFLTMRAGKAERPEFSVRLIGRLLFCWFLKNLQSDNKQPLIPENLLCLDKAQTDDYYRKVIEPLFFDVLNTPIDKRTTTLENHASIPYLNGGLFEKQQSDNSSEVKNDWFNGFFETLSRYNFTIDENSANDTEVSIDPEMLGTIFENLLAEQDPDTQKSARKASGSFYTPRVIVDYMAEQSLTAYLQQKTKVDNAKILALFKESINKDEQTTSKEAEQLLTALFELKILDPACGSGAFPMGVMQKILVMLQRLDRDGSWWEKAQRRTIKGESKEAKALKSRLENANAEYVHKLGIVSRCLYGVDIQPIAAEITKLRCFLSLIIDEKIDDDTDNRGIVPLPNLEFKFVTANSLLDLPKADKQGDLFLKPEWLDELKTLRDEYLQSFGRPKETAKNKFQSIQADIQKYVPNDLLTQANKLEENPFYQLAHWQPFEGKATNWFDPKWMFGVEQFDIVIGNPPYVQLQKIKDKTAKAAYEKAGFATHKGTGDLYALFYEKGIQQLKDDGLLCYITSNKWMRAGYGDVVRGFFAQYNPLLLLDFGGFKVFDSATVDTNILLIQKSENNGQTHATHFKSDFKKGDSIGDYVADNHHTLNFDNDKTWAILPPIEQAIQAKIERLGTPLKEWDIQINYGIKTGYNEAFIISGEKRAELIRQDPRSAEIIKPILRGKDIKQYHYDFADLYILFIPWHFPLHTDNSINGASKKAEKEFEINYPAVYQHLLSHKDKLSQRNKSETGIRYEWYALQRWGAKYFEEFEKEKIVYKDIGNAFVLDSNKNFFNNTIYMISGENLKYLLVFLNSRIIEFAFKKFYASTLGDKAPRWFSQFVVELPIPLLKNLEKIEIMAERLMADYDNLALLAQTNSVVYELYELTQEEIDYIENALEKEQ